MVQLKRFGTELNPLGFPKESLIYVKSNSDGGFPVGCNSTEARLNQNEKNKFK